jgi:riboflavin biosynthesis pyrimidine reductase
MAAKSKNDPAVDAYLATLPENEQEAFQNLRRLIVDAGEGAWRSLLEHDLWAGIYMLVHPLVIGNGNSLFV